MSRLGPSIVRYMSQNLGQLTYFALVWLSSTKRERDYLQTKVHEKLVEAKTKFVQDCVQYMSSRWRNGQYFALVLLSTTSTETGYLRSDVREKFAARNSMKWSQNSFKISSSTCQPCKKMVRTLTWSCWARPTEKMDTYHLNSRINCRC